MIKKIATGAAAALASFALVATPAFAAVVDPGEVNIINADGGTNEDNGLKVTYGFGQLQILMNNAGQLYDADALPLADTYANMSNYPIIKFEGFGDIGAENNWDSFTSDATVTDGGRSGVVVNHLTYGADASLVKVDVTVSYTYPNKYISMTMALVETGSDYSGLPHKFYWYTDAMLTGQDAGFQFGGTSPEGATVAGVVSEAGDQIEAFRQVAGQNLNWFSGYYDCPVGATDECSPTLGDGAWIENFLDFPSVAYESDATVDNGFGISSPSSTNATEEISFDLLFVSCLDGVNALQCADAGLGLAEPELAETGVNASAFGFAGAAALFAAAAVIAVRRRSNV